MKNSLSTWDEVRRMADELEVQMHLAGMEARDRWRALQPQLREIEDLLARSGKRASEVVQAEIASLGEALRKLRDDLANALKD